MHPKDLKHGFTLIELLVAITIVAILSVIGMTVYRDTIKNAKDTKIKQDIDSIAIAYEQHYNTATSKYPKLQSVWFGNGIPQTPQRDPYDCLVPESGAASFKICANLSDGTATPYCKRSAFGEAVDCTASTPSTSPSPTVNPPPSVSVAPSPSPVGRSLCADGTNDKVYSSNMVGCNGSATSGSSNVLCASGAHVCSVAEYSARGGNAATNPSDAIRYLSNTYSSVNSCDSDTRNVFHPGADTSIVVAPAVSTRSNYDSATCGTSNPGWYTGGAGTFGVVCCN